jgi:PadR family transcriptional regulator, regulatory protein PadR
MELRPPSYFVLAALIDGPLHGYGIMRRAKDLSDGRVRLSTGTLYSVLDRAMSESLVTVGDQYEVGGRQRRDYTLTPAGRLLLQQEAEQMARSARTVIKQLRVSPGALA